MILLKASYGKGSPKKYIFKSDKDIKTGDLVIVQSGDQTSPITEDNAQVVRVTGTTKDLSKLPSNLTMDRVNEVKGLII